MLTKRKVIEKLKKVIDPELGINIIDLGLIYNIKISTTKKVSILMTLTTPGCPLAGIFEELVSNAVSGIKEVKDISVKLTFEPPWTQEMMSEEAKIELGFE